MPFQRSNQTKAQKKNAAQAKGSKNVPQQPNIVPDVDDDKAEDQMNVAETYADYMPTKLKIGVAHPDAVVETSSLASVEPVDITYKLEMSEDVYEDGDLSALQLESIVYASQAHAQLLPDGTRAGFLIGMDLFIAIFFESKVLVFLKQK